MAERLEKADVVHLVSARLNRDTEAVAEIVEAFWTRRIKRSGEANASLCAASAPSTSDLSATAGHSSSTRRSACARCSAGGRAIGDRHKATVG